MFGFLKGRRRKKLKAAPFPAEWLEIIERNVALYRRLPEADRRELLGHVQVFLAEKPFEGCGGLEITDEIRVTVAAQACLLLLHRRTDYFPRLRSIVVYPTSFVAKTVKQEGPGMIAEGQEARLGEAWLRGPLVLSWDDVLADAAGSRTGSNVVLHEFAHELDDEDGEANGAPALERGPELRRLGARARRGLRAAPPRRRARPRVGPRRLRRRKSRRVFRRGDGVPSSKCPWTCKSSSRSFTRSWRSFIGRIRRVGKRRATMDDRRCHPAQGRACRAIGGPRWSIVCRPSSLVTSVTSRRSSLSAAWRAR